MLGTVFCFARVLFELLVSDWCDLDDCGGYCFAVGVVGLAACWFAGGCGGLVVCSDEVFLWV